MRSDGTPNCPQNGPRNPRETVVANRPPDKRSMTANCSNAFIGCVKVPTNVNDPSCTRDVS